MVLAKLNPYNSIPAHKGLVIHIHPNFYLSDSSNYFVAGEHLLRIFHYLIKYLVKMKTHQVAVCYMIIWYYITCTGEITHRQSSSNFITNRKTINSIHEWHNICKLIDIEYSVGGHQRPPTEYSMCIYWGWHSDDGNFHDDGSPGENICCGLLWVLWIVKNNGFLIFNHKIPIICQSQIYIKRIIINLRKNSSFNWFTPFHVLICPDVIWKKISRPLYHVHFTMIQTNSRHKWHHHSF